MEAVCHWADVSSLKDPAHFRHGLSLLRNKERKEKALAFRYENGRALSLGVSLLLEQALREVGITEYELSLEPRGKPVLVHQDLHFSLSHSGSFAVCALSCSPIGADVELIKPLRTQGVLRFLHPDETAEIQQSEDPALAFIRIWTRKESYGKRNGTGIAYDMKGISFLEAHPEDSYRFHELCIDGHMITVCTGPQETVRFVKTELPV